MGTSIYKINQRIWNIKNTGIQPITSRPISAIYRPIIARKGAWNEGTILNYSQAKRQYKNITGKDLTKEQYNEILSDFVNSDVNKRLTVSNSINEYIEMSEYILRNQLKDSPFAKKIQRLSKRKQLQLFKSYFDLISGKDSAEGEDWKYRFEEYYNNWIELQ